MGMIRQFANFINAKPVQWDLTYSASQTAQTVLAPSSGKILIITNILVSALTAGKITIFDDVNAQGKRLIILNPASKGGCVENYEGGRDLDGTLKYTTGAGASGEIVVKGYEIGI